MEKCRNQRISSPIAANPVRVRVAAAAQTGIGDRGSGIGDRGSGIRVFFGIWALGFGLWDFRSTAPIAVVRFIATAIIWVVCSPNDGTSAKSVMKHPAAAPSVLAPYRIATREPVKSVSERRRWRINTVRVPPISIVTG